MAESNYVSYIDTQYSQIVPISPQIKQIPDQPGQNYQEIILQYNYGTKENPKVSQFLMEWPIVYSNGGIIEKEESSKFKDGRSRYSYSMMISLPQQDHNVSLLIQRMNDVHSACSYIIGQFKTALKMYDFDANRPGGLFKNPLYFPRDQTTGSPIEGRDPTIFLKLYKRGFGATEERTLFTDLEGKPINWQLLKGVEMKFIPLVHVEKIYVGGGKASLQLKMVSAVVTWIAAKNTVTKQMETIKKYLHKNPEASQNLAEQITKLSNERKDFILPKNNSMLDSNSGHGNVTTSSFENFLANAPKISSPLHDMNTSPSPPLVHSSIPKPPSMMKLS